MLIRRGQGSKGSLPYLLSRGLGGRSAAVGVEGHAVAEGLAVAVERGYLLCMFEEKFVRPDA